MNTYAIWNNKGGTGKSTITFHLASRFAELNPTRRVLVIDLCPQANSSMLFLGGGVKGEQALLELCSMDAAHSVVGFTSEYIVNRRLPDNENFIVNTQERNEKMPKNLYLLAGDGNLELMAPAIIDEANRTPIPGLADPWAFVHEMFKNLTDHLTGHNWTVFIDTNPSFSIYTELAICAATRLLIPINADDSSRVAVKALFALIHGTNPPHPFFGNYTFAAKAAARNMRLPKVHLAIGNRFTQYKGAAAAFLAFSSASRDQLYDEFLSDPTRFTQRDSQIGNVEEFENNYVLELRDFNTAGVVAAHHGTPLSGMRQDYYQVHSDPEVKVNKSQIDAGLKAIDPIVKILEP